jgi:HlyD family secretion protein
MNGEAPGKAEREGVFTIANDRVFFRPVKTGITGKSDIEIVAGLDDGEAIVTGSYQALRTLADNARVKIEQ